MRKARDQETIHTIPEGAYESGVGDQEQREDINNPQLTLTTDAQGNGYPADQLNKEKGD